MTTKAKPVKLGHPKLRRGQTEAFGDSDRGLHYFARTGCRRVDGNALPNRYGNPANTHYELFQNHGFVWARSSGKPARSAKVSDLSMRELRGFHTRRGHYAIDSSLNRIELAFKLGMDYEFEPKGRFTPEAVQRFHHKVAKLEEQHPGRKVIVKVYNNKPGKAMWLKPFHEVGFPTLITTHTPFRKTDARAEQYADEYRGFKPRWV